MKTEELERLYAQYKSEKKEDSDYHTRVYKLYQASKYLPEPKGGLLSKQCPKCGAYLEKRKVEYPYSTFIHVFCSECDYEYAYPPFWDNFGVNIFG